jgi:hypothetical protein
VVESRAQRASDEGNEDAAVCWRELMAVPEAAAAHQYAACERSALAGIDLLLARSEKFDGGLPHLDRLLRRLLDGMLSITAKGDRATVMEIFMNALCDAVNDFGGLATTKPEIFQEWAERGFAVPGMISPNAEKTADNARLVKQLRVGEKFHLAIQPTGKRGRRWKFQTTANGLASRLQSYIANSIGCYELHKAQAKQAGRELPLWLHDAVRLKSFSAKTWRAWADIAWQVLAEISPDGKPEDHDAFYKTETAICDVRLERGGYSASGAPSVAKEDIREALFGAFELIATGTSRRTKRRLKGQPKKQRKGSPDN